MDRNMLALANDWDFGRWQPELSYAPLELVDIVFFEEQNLYLHRVSAFQRFDAKLLRESGLEEQIRQERAEQLLDHAISQETAWTPESHQSMEEMFQAGQPDAPDGMPANYADGVLKIHLTKDDGQSMVINITLPDGSIFPYPQIKKCHHGVVPIVGEKYIFGRYLKDNTSLCLPVTDYDIVQESIHTRAADVVSEEELLNLPDHGTYFLSDPLIVSARIIRRGPHNPLQSSDAIWEPDSLKLYRNIIKGEDRKI